MKKSKAAAVLKIDKERCKGCMLCLAACPLHLLRMSEDVNKKGLKYVVMTDAEKCTGCGMCVLSCPDCAIELEKE